MKKSLYSLIGLALVFAACSTIEDRVDLGPVLKADQLVFSVTQPVAGSNTIILENKTPNTLQYWDWGTGFSNKLNDTIYVPFAGTFTMRFTAFCGGGTVTDSTTFTIAQNDDAFFEKNPLWKQLTGGGTGQTWVWAIDNPTGKVAGNGPEECTSPAWWTLTPTEVVGQLTGKYSLDDEVYMDLNGAANFVVKHGDGSQVKGFFGMLPDVTYAGITFNSFEVIGGPQMPWPGGGKYHVTKITADELVVHEYKAFNIAMFKRKGFVY
ncbi:MAG TPA: hypothetical protein VFC65_14900 [Prolixibacteraceae bacterium]|nr:hypothetical protein [Prolixibacteraceae bacterium]